ncbi:MAG: hypothetical protein KC503_18750 [Myxococcales bacterium]|nr:hypothetical protein [Myxococcales bacterium]
MALLLSGSLAACARFEGQLRYVPDAKAAPTFSATAQDGQARSLSHLTATGPLVLVFLRGFS